MKRTQERCERLAEIAGRDLWKWSIVEIEELINVGMIHPLDEAKIASLYLELYALGDRPTVEEMSEYLQNLWPWQGKRMRQRVLSFWERVLDNPERRFACLRETWSWRYPFLIPETVALRERLTPPDERLAEQVKRAAEIGLDVLRQMPASDEADRALRRIAFAARALTIWGVTRDSHPEARWSGNIFRVPTDPLKEFASLTNRGRAQHDAWLTRIREEHEREIAGQGATEVREQEPAS